MFYIFIFILGLSVGSFLNVLIDRLPKGQSILGRSKCDHCGKVLGWRELIPVLSFLLQKGRCRYCGRKIAWQYPVVEVITGLLFLLIFNFQFSIFNKFSITNYQLPKILVTGYVLYVTCSLIVIFVSDLKYFIIPDKVIYPGIILVLIFNGVAERSSALSRSFISFRFTTPFWGAFLAALMAGGFFLLLVLITKGKGMGLGDVKLAVLMGLILSWPKIALAIFVAFLVGALVGLGLVLAKRKTLKSEIPFGTFLSAATILILFLGDKIFSYFRIFS